jgi:hypothetical protein
MKINGGMWLTTVMRRQTPRAGTFARCEFTLEVTTLVEKIRISQHPALMIEIARAAGISDEEICRLASGGDVSRLQPLGQGDFDFTELTVFAREKPEVLRQALFEGYEISFNTMGGIRCLLLFMFGLKVEQDYRQGDGHLTDIPLRTDQETALRSILSRYWRIVELAYNPDTHTKTVRIEMVPYSV